MARPIVIWPDRVLNEPTRPVEDFGPELSQLLDEMMEALEEAEGIGIAANQIGVPLRVAWVGREDGTFFEIVNPEVIERSEPSRLEEGCLSLPDEWHKCPRFKRCKVRFQDREGAWHELEADDKLAHVLQHEIDHLDGQVFVQHLSALKMGLVRERMQKLKRRMKKER